MTEDQPQSASTRPSPPTPSASSAELGELRCRRCRYNLKGLSIRGVCPECALPIRATLLAVVDPMAREIQPLRWPWMTAAGLQMWAHGAFLACLVVLGLRIDSALAIPWLSFEGRVHAGLLAALLAAVSGVGSLCLISPHAGLTRREQFMALAGSALYIPIVASLAIIHRTIDPVHMPGFSLDEDPPLQRMLWKLVCDAAIFAGVLLTRPNARLLAARSLLMRTGDVNRQTLAALAAAVAISVVGDLLLLAASTEWTRGFWDSATRWSGHTMILVGGALLLIGCGGVVLDVWRLMPVIVSKPLDLSDVVKENRA